MQLPAQPICQSHLALYCCVHEYTRESCGEHHASCRLLARQTETVHSYHSLHSSRAVCMQFRKLCAVTKLVCSQLKRAAAHEAPGSMQHLISVSPAMQASATLVCHHFRNRRSNLSTAPPTINALPIICLRSAASDNTDYCRCMFSVLFFRDVLQGGAHRLVTCSTLVGLLC